jgi:hypothetical protein
VIEIVHQGRLEDPNRPVLIIEYGLTITRKGTFSSRCQLFAAISEGQG